MMEIFTNPHRSDVQCNLFFIGNVSRGDDAAAPELLSQLTCETEFAQACRQGIIQVTECWQLQPEHLYAVQNGSPMIFIDASKVLRTGISFQAVKPFDQFSFSSHHLSVGNFLALYEKVFCTSAAPAWLLGIAGRQYELGAAISEQTQLGIQQAKENIMQLVRLDCWRLLKDPILQPAGGSAYA